MKTRVEGFYSIKPLKLFRKTEGVIFDIIPKELVSKTSSIDRVLHDKNAISPGPVNEIKRPWYMHFHQQDNLVVLQGHRIVELFSLDLDKKIIFKIYPNKILCDDKILLDEGCVLTWEENIFHRIISGEEGSASLNFAVRSEGFDVKNNFNIYSLDENLKTYKSIREGFQDQF
jgi:hypothetical protein